ncbi:MAG: hypothetical protein Q4D87_08965 [Actinomycetaceae bacterium]|nr:hypothetical protein [Actinomycetaceae bacterium]
MLKEYFWRGGTWQFDERDAPADAVLKSDADAVEAEADAVEGEPVVKGRKPANKARTPANK